MPELGTQSLTATAYATLRADMPACRVSPGEKLKISEICWMPEFSLGAVREALSRLTSEGLVAVEQNNGCRAAPITVSPCCRPPAQVSCRG